MRLIDADALKDSLVNAHINRVITFDINTFRCVMNCIDNAPTVEPDKELKEKIETYKNAYKIMSDAFECEVRKNTRPQGEQEPKDNE